MTYPDYHCYQRQFPHLAAKQEVQSGNGCVTRPKQGLKSGSPTIPTLHANVVNGGMPRNMQDLSLQ